MNPCRLEMYRNQLCMWQYSKYPAVYILYVAVRQVPSCAYTVHGSTASTELCIHCTWQHGKYRAVYTLCLAVRQVPSCVYTYMAVRQVPSCVYIVRGSTASTELCIHCTWQYGKYRAVYTLYMTVRQVPSCDLLYMAVRQVPSCE